MAINIKRNTCYLQYTIAIFLLATSLFANAQNKIVTGNNMDSSSKKNIYGKPRSFAFITNLPSDIVQIPKRSFNKHNIKNLLLVAGTSGALIFADQSIYNGTRKFSDNLHLHPEERNKIIWSLKKGNKETVLLKAPKNLNTAFYNIGQGFTTLLVASGFFIQGKISKNNTSLQTASDLTESFIALGLVTQLLKYSAGRQDPIASNSDGGRWRPFPSINAFQKDKTHYDAFPSGHLSTLMAAVTILANNYPENKLIKPIGYSLLALSGFAMVNNGVHWAGDYPLAIGLGYLTGNIISSRHKRVAKTVSIVPVF